MNYPAASGRGINQFTCRGLNDYITTCRNIILLLNKFKPGCLARQGKKPNRELLISGRPQTLNASDTRNREGFYQFQ